MAQHPIITTASRELAQNRKVHIQAACFAGWQRLKTIAEPEPGLARLTIETDDPFTFYTPAGAISGIRIDG